MRVLQFSGCFKIHEDAPDDVREAIEASLVHFLGAEPESYDSSMPPDAVSEKQWIAFWKALGEGRRLHITADITELDVDALQID
jgi:hypothetical protein